MKAVSTLITELPNGGVEVDFEYNPKPKGTQMLSDEQVTLVARALCDAVASGKVDEQTIPGLREALVKQIAAVNGIKPAPVVTKPAVIELDPRRWRVDVGVLSLVVVLPSETEPSGQVHFRFPQADEPGSVLSRVIREAREATRGYLRERSPKPSRTARRARRRASVARSASAKVPGSDASRKAPGETGR